MSLPEYPEWATDLYWGGYGDGSVYGDHGYGDGRGDGRGDCGWGFGGGEGWGEGYGDGGGWGWGEEGE